MLLGCGDPLSRRSVQRTVDLDVLQQRLGLGVFGAALASGVLVELLDWLVGLDGPLGVLRLAQELLEVAGAREVAPQRCGVLRPRIDAGVQAAAERGGDVETRPRAAGARYGL